jgi:hypothetical protein
MREPSTWTLKRGIRLLFWPALAIWTWLLVKPNPFPEIVRILSSWAELLIYLAHKTAHIGGYAGFLFLAAACYSAPIRQVMILLVVVHGPLSELGQYLGNRWFETGRHGCVLDVVIDWAGMAGGYVLWLLMQRRGKGLGEPTELNTDERVG